MSLSERLSEINEYAGDHNIEDDSVYQEEAEIIQSLTELGVAEHEANAITVAVSHEEATLASGDVTYRDMQNSLRNLGNAKRLIGEDDSGIYHEENASAETTMRVAHEEAIGTLKRWGEAALRLLTRVINTFKKWINKAKLLFDKTTEMINGLIAKFKKIEKNKPKSFKFQATSDKLKLDPKLMVDVTNRAHIFASTTDYTPNKIVEAILTAVSSGEVLTAAFEEAAKIEMGTSAKFRSAVVAFFKGDAFAKIRLISKEAKDVVKTYLSEKLAVSVDDIRIIAIGGRKVGYISIIPDLDSEDDGGVSIKSGLMTLSLGDKDISEAKLKKQIITPTDMIGYLEELLPHSKSMKVNIDKRIALANTYLTKASRIVKEQKSAGDADSKNARDEVKYFRVLSSSVASTSAIAIENVKLATAYISAVYRAIERN